MPYDTTVAPRIASGDVVGPVATIGANGAVTQKSGVLIVTKSGVCAMTIGNPVSGAAEAGGDDGKVLTIISATASAHTLTYSTTGFNAGGAGADVGTFGGAKGDGLTLVAYGGVWYVATKTNVTLA